jgi:hypothetical protein
LRSHANSGFAHGIGEKYRPGQDWSYEEEYQLVLDNYMMEFRAPESRMLRHHFADLSGVTFGIRTPMNAKVEIRRIVEEECRKEGRTDFKFYQAFYARSIGTIEHAEMSSSGLVHPPGTARRLQGSMRE